MKLTFAVCLQHRRRWSDQRDKQKPNKQKTIYFLKIKTTTTNKQDEEEKKIQNALKKKSEF